jgi:hypothetical protein
MQRETAAALVEKNASAAALPPRQTLIQFNELR